MLGPSIHHLCTQKRAKGCFEYLRVCIACYGIIVYFHPIGLVWLQGQSPALSLS